MVYYCIFKLNLSRLGDLIWELVRFPLTFYPPIIKEIGVKFDSHDTYLIVTYIPHLYKILDIRNKIARKCSFYYPKLLQIQIYIKTTLETFHFNLTPF